MTLQQKGAIFLLYSSSAIGLAGEGLTAGLPEISGQEPAVKETVKEWHISGQCG